MRDIQTPNSWDKFELIKTPDFKEEYSLMDFQAYGVYQALSQSRFIFGFPTGCGKTYSSLATFFYYKTIYPQTKLIIVTNNSALFQFASELDKFFQHSLNIQIVHSTAKEVKQSKYLQQRKDFITSFSQVGGETLDVLVFNYPILRKEKEKVVKAVQKLSRQEWKTFLILDEITNFKNMKTQTFKAVYALQSFAEKVIAMTATLTKGRLEEMYSVFKGIGLLLAKTKAEFESQYCIIWQHPKFFYIRNVKGYKNVAELKKRIEPYSLILKKSEVVSSLPEFQFQKRILDHSQDQMDLIKEIYSGVLNLGVEAIDYSQNIFENSGVKVLEEITEQGYIKRALLTPEVVAPEKYTDLSPKTEEILRMLEDEFTDEKVVIYTPSKKYLKTLVKTIKKTKELPMFYKSPLEISGDVDACKRFENIQLFSESPEHNLILLTDAGSESINLQSASVLILTTLPKTWGDLIQLVGRINRIGSKNKHLLLVYLLHEGSQDVFEYNIIHQQGIIFQAIHGDVEKGLLDTSAHKGEEHQHLTDEEFVSKSVQHLLLSTRKRLISKYS